MTALDVIFTSLAVLAFLATAWVSGVIAWRLVKGPKR